MSKHIRPSHQYDESYVPSNLVHLLKRYGEIHALDNDYMSQLHFLAVKAAGEIERLQARNEVLEEKLQRIEQWCVAYPRTVFIEPTDDGWKRANEVLNITDDCPSLTAISGSNMRHVVEVIAAIAAAQEVKE